MELIKPKIRSTLLYHNLDQLKSKIRKGNFIKLKGKYLTKVFKVVEKSDAFLVVRSTNGILYKII